MEPGSSSADQETTVRLGPRPGDAFRALLMACWAAPRRRRACWRRWPSSPRPTPSSSARAWTRTRPTTTAPRLPPAQPGIRPAGGQIRLRVRYQDLGTDWFDYLFATVQELKGLLATTGWRLAQVETERHHDVAVLRRTH